MGRRWLSPTNDNYSCWWTTTSIVGRQPAAPSRHPNHSASHPKLLDFGIAKATSNLSSEIGVLKGKVSYMSPEQVRGLPIDRRSDIFSLGIVLHEMLTLEKLFRGESSFQMMDLVRTAEVAPPSSINPRVHPEIDGLVLRALKKEREHRFQTAGEMGVEIAKALERYNFAKHELRDLLLDLCREEYEEEQEKIKGFRESRPPTVETQIPEQAEDYGMMIEIVDGPIETNPELPAPTKTAPYIWVLLGVAVFLIILAVVLLILL
jgi:serine/threonine protein kinase